MKPSDGKIAIFVCGPVRYTLYVSRMIDRIFAGYDYDCFYHIWKKDLGNKVRAGEVEDLEEVQNNPRTKVLIRQEPYRPEDFENTVGMQTGSNSSINATMGMFFSVNVLCHYLEQLPDFSSYRYILRLRTDCAIFNPQFPSLLDASEQTLTFAKSYFIPEEVVCDHLCFGTIPSFFAVWRFADMDEIYRTYLEAGRNPEAVLRCRLQKCPQIRLTEGPVRFRDYHIVYYPTRDCDPASISSALNRLGIEAFFESGGQEINQKEIEQFNEKWKQHWISQKTAASNQPRFSFVMIVLNGMPFVEYSLKSVYEFAHEIIIVEGAVEKCMFAANPDGSSTDGTVEFLRQFPDPARKIRLIQGRWPEKCQMQNEALKYVTGDYVWLIDSDEVYKRQDLEKIRTILKNDPSITQVNFIFDNFWKGLDYIFVSKKFFETPQHCRRVFKYKPGSVFTSHRPPTLRWPNCEQTTEQMRLLDGLTTRRLGIIPCHYSYVLDSQVRQKIELYRRYGWGKMWNLDLEEWYEQCFRKWTPDNRRQIEKQWPVWTGDPQSYTEPFTGTHPEVMIEYLLRRAKIHQNGRGTVIMEHLIDAVKEIKNAFQERPLSVLETGTIRTYEERHYSTYFLARELDKHGKLITVDIDPLSIQRSQNICYGFSNIQYVLSDSQVYLAGLKNQKFHLVFLDSVNDGDFIFREFLYILPWMADGGIVMIDDAGILPDGSGKDLTSAAQKGHRIWEFLRACQAEYTVLAAPGGHGTQLKLVLNPANKRKINGFLKSQEQDNHGPTGVKQSAAHSETISTVQQMSSSSIESPDREKKGTDSGPLKVAEEYVRHGMAVSDGSAFSEAVRRIVQQVRPRKIIETGTYLGRGTTAIVAEALRQNGIEGTFYTIEVNPAYYAQAKAYLESRGYAVKPLCGLSIPRRLLPGREQIPSLIAQAAAGESVFVDHPESVRAQRYYQETDFPDVPDDLLGRCLEAFEGRPDFVLLDSAGHLGWIEFQYLLERLQGPCILALDDIYHVKHCRSFQQMQKDERFEILTASNEKFGFCIARFDPTKKTRPALGPLPEPRHILWLRPDAIGDGVLSSAMLPVIRRRFPGARLTVLVQESAAPLYEACPAVDEILRFRTEEMYNPSQFLQTWAPRIWQLKADWLLHSVYSRQFLMDSLVYASKIPIRIGMEGDCCNIPPEQKAHTDGWYTHLIPSPGHWKLELDRHRDFLKGLGCETDSLKPTIWLTQEDEAFARRWLEENKVSGTQLLVLFAGARTFHRLYEGYGQALENTVVSRGWTVLSLGGGRDFEINQQNLDRLAQKGVRTFNLCGKLSLRQTAALIKHCRLAVGAETGLAHIAAALEVPHVIVIGGGHFGRFMPYSPKTTLAVLPLDCYGCNWVCRYGPEKIYCIRDLEPSVLAEAVEQTVQKTSSKPRIFVQDASLYQQADGGPAWKTLPDVPAVGQAEISVVSAAQKAADNPTKIARQVPIAAHSFHSSFPKITVVTPSYNQAPYLEACIQSVLNQGYPNLEYIIMDGGSTDGSVEIIKKYEKYLAYWQSRPDGGQYAAIEEGFRRSTGQIMTWLNSDDMFFPDAFEIASAVFSERPDIEWLTGRVVNFNEDGSVKAIREELPLWCRAKYLKKDYRDPYLQQEGTFWRRSLWEKAGGCMRTDLNLAGDLELWTRFFRHADLHTLDAVLAGYRLQPNRKIATQLEQYHQEADRILEEELVFYSKQTPRPKLAAAPAPLSALEICRYRQAFRRSYEQSRKQTGGQPPVGSARPVRKLPAVLATSLAPRNIENQKRAVQSWLQAGFVVLSVNNPDEIAGLRPLFPQVGFLAASRNGQSLWGKPTVFLDDIFSALKQSGFETAGIINSDIYLSLTDRQIEMILNKSETGLLCLNRWNAVPTDRQPLRFFSEGFDVFFFPSSFLERIPPSVYCMGIPWWDFYVPMRAAVCQVPLMRFREPAAFHLEHSVKWDRRSWLAGGCCFFKTLLDWIREAPGLPVAELKDRIEKSWTAFSAALVQESPDEKTRKLSSYADFILGYLYGRMEDLGESRPHSSVPELPPEIAQALSSGRKEKPVPVLKQAAAGSAPRVTALVSTYNAEAYLKGCLEDLLSQTLYEKGQLEIVVIDSGSEQNEGAVVRDYQSRYPNIRYLRTPQRETIYAAWNRGVRLASGRYLTSANTDDRHRPDALEVLADALDADPNVGLVYGDQIISDRFVDTFTEEIGQKIPRPDYSYERLLFGCCVGSQPMWRKSLHDELGFFNESLTVAGDWDFWLRIAARYPFKRVPQYLGLYYNNPDSAEHHNPIHSLYERWLVGRRFGNPYISTIPRCIRKDNPLVSVIVPAYNAARYIGNAIESVLIQNYPHLELLIINDGSDDDTEAVVRRYADERIQYFVRERGGPSAARNEGIRRSRGEFLVMLDADDSLSIEHLGQMLEAYDRYPDCDLIYCKTLLTDEKGRPVRIHQQEEYSNPCHLIGDLFQSGFPIVPFRTMIRRRVFEQIGMYDPSLWVAEDYDLWRRFLKQGLKFRYWPNSFYIRRQREDAWSKTVTPEKAAMHFSVLQKYVETFEPNELFPEVSWERFTGDVRKFLFHSKVCGVFLGLGEQYKTAGSSACLIQLAHEEAVRHLEICRSICPEQPAIASLEQRCRALLAESGFPGVLEGAGAGGCAPVA